MTEETDDTRDDKQDETSAFDYPMHVATLDEVPEEDRDLYVSRGEGYALIPQAGMAIFHAKYETLAKHHAEVLALRDGIVELLERHVNALEASNKILTEKLAEQTREEAMRERFVANDKYGNVFASMLSEVLN